ncbi:ribosome biogenesis protein Nop16 [Suillus clintonianus]|uniref:ribosome biogenesis protein Nop16 n=1 Tax=Suillus clintonianus TaxID=1904413 RepID=UPI001B87BE59|nr:ribosome biogenesis protein Nop16 [Suillus clintonianus]KAG2149393.1 ribosome biogenesis protein Nop16 [Suillus clintonianus]
MANPRQRRKAKSSTHKAVSHSRRAQKILKKMPVIRGPKALQDAWDKSKTLHQNYAALGLQVALTPTQSGGSERTLIPPKGSASTGSVSGIVKPVEAGPSNIPRGFGRIIRDEFGNVIRIDLPESEEMQDCVPNSELPEVEVDEKTMHDWVGCLDKINDQNNAQVSSVGGRHAVVELEKLSASGRTVPRHSSCGERSYLARLIQKYGDDYDSMARDRRLNPEQKTVGELKRAVGKAGGVETFS